MTNRWIYIVMLLASLLAACGGLSEDQKKKINDQAKKDVLSSLDKQLAKIGQAVPPDQCEGASLCTDTKGQSIECPDGCNDSCNGTCNKPKHTDEIEMNVTADIGGKLGTATATFKMSFVIETLEHKKMKHNHKNESPTKGKDPGKWVNWYMSFRGKVQVTSAVKVTTQTGQTYSMDLTITDETYDFARCGFTSCGGECGPTPTPTPSPSPSPSPTQSPTPTPTQSPTPTPTQSPTPPPASPTPTPTPSPTPPPPSPTATASASPTPWPTYSPTPWPTYSPTPYPTYSPTPYPTYSPTPYPTAMGSAASF